MTTTPIVVVVDDDNQVRESLGWIVRSVGLTVECYSSPDEVLNAARPDAPGCFIIDLQLPGMSGFELRKRLVEKGCYQPFIMLSGHGDISLAVQAMRLGAQDYVEKPFHHQRLLDSIQKAIACDVESRRKQAERAVVERRLATLTSREREVIGLVITGTLSKRIANQLGISMKTVEVHRSHIMKKMEVDSMVQLTRLLTQFALLD